nr:hypothetical protein [Corynebacterium sp. MSK156]
PTPTLTLSPDSQIQEGQIHHSTGLDRTDELWAPWFVIPTDNKKYARMALKYLIVDALRHLNLSWPAPEFDPEAEKQRILDVD